jgi:hypothetical protein
MLVVRDNAAMSRFEMTSGDAIAFVEYRRDGDRIALTHIMGLRRTGQKLARPGSNAPGKAPAQGAGSMSARPGATCTGGQPWLP